MLALLRRQRSQSGQFNVPRLFVMSLKDGRILDKVTGPLQSDGGCC